MTPDLRVVCDTNVVVSAMLLPLSIPRRGLDRAMREGRLLISPATITELAEVIHRPGFDKYLSEEERIEFLTALVREAELVNVMEIVTACRDPRDNKFWSWPFLAGRRISLPAMRTCSCFTPFAALSSFRRTSS